MEKTKLFTTTALLAALIILLGLTPIGMINFGVVYVSFLCIPVILGTLALGLKQGILLGVCMGAVSFYKAITAPSTLVAEILAGGVIWVVILCFVPRILVPFVASQIMKAMQNKKISLRSAIASACGSFTNTVFYLGGILLLYYVLGIQQASLLATLGTITLSAGIPEAIAAGILIPPILLALQKAKLINLR